MVKFIKLYIYEIIFLILTVCLTLPRIFLEPAFWDETFSWVITNNSYIGIIGATAKDTHPPLYYETLKFWSSIFSDIIVSMRVLSLLFWVISAFLIILIVKKLDFNKTQKLLLYSILSVLPITIYLSTFIRMYTMALCLILASIYFFILYLDGYRKKYLFLYSLFSLFALYTLNITLFAYIGINIFFLIKKLNLISEIGENQSIIVKFRQLLRDKEFLIYLFSQAIVILIYIPWLLVIIKQSGGSSAKQLAWISPIDFTSIFYVVSILFGNVDNYKTNISIFTGIIFFIIISILCYINFSKLIRGKIKNDIPFLFFSIFFTSVVIIILLSIKQSVLIPRSFFIATITFTIFMISIIKIKDLFIFKAFILLFVIFYSFTIFNSYRARYQGVNGANYMSHVFEPVNQDKSVKLIITKQQGQYPIAYQQVKYFTRINLKTILLDKSTDSGDYIIYTKDDFVDINNITQDFYYFTYTENHVCPDVSRFYKIMDNNFEELDVKGELCKYKLI